MSSSIDGNGYVAGVVVEAAAALTVGSIIGTGWLAWQGGKLIVEANRALDRQISKKKRQLEAEARCRKMAAVSAHEQLVDMCSQILSQLGKDNNIESDEIEQIKSELTSIINDHLPEDTVQIEILNSLGYLKLDKVIRQRNRIASMTMKASKTGVQGLSVAELMDNIRLVSETISVNATRGQDVVAIDPDVLERMKLNEEFSSVTAEIIDALETVEELSKPFGLTTSAKTWYQSCFNGIDTQIEVLCRPTTSNKELKKGISRLRDAVNQYKMTPGTEQDLRRARALYKVYVDASRALNEAVLDFKTFEGADEIENKMFYLQERAQRAQECAELYKKLGPSAYMCYAYDRELKALGYTVHTKNKIAEMAMGNPVKAKVGEYNIPFYKWNKKDLTQLYSIGSQCDLQVIVHDDGSVSMQTIAEEKSEDVINAQRSYCSQIKVLHERLRKKWFIIHDYEEAKPPEEIMTVAQWSNSRENIWRKSDEGIIIDQRAKAKETDKIQRMQ